MSADKYESLVKGNELYPLAFIEKFQSTCPHWELDTWAKRERYLCYDMVCVLLANLEMSEEIEEMMLNELKRKFMKDKSYEEEEENKQPLKRSRLDPGPSIEEELDYEYKSDIFEQDSEEENDESYEFEDESKQFEADQFA
ncbi:unnamed protein product [Psylliodes chrysocephalus]|uniref:Uncharacterized protein n=1 Tax=Psylliodes chrysocephalus TaxID=3402493 RepID=A0A9P0D6I5_9CUCU|nr:unnamed protein product [Psylliodes chrysocephala]